MLAPGVLVRHHLRGAADDGEADDPGRHELDGAHAEVADARLDPEGGALLGAGEEVRGARHEAGERAAADAGEDAEQQQDGVGSLGVLHREGPPDERYEEEGGREGDELAGAHDRWEEGPDQAQRAAGEPGHGDEPVELALAQVEADAVELGCDR